MAGIFISYRRADSEETAGRIYDQLTQVYGSDLVFEDVDTISAGTRWEDAIDSAISTSDVALVIIGPDWLNTSDKQTGRRRLDDPNDELRQEVEKALQDPGTRVIPVLIGGATMPDRGDLPDGLVELSRRQARTVRGGEHFHNDVAALIEAIGEIGLRSRITKRWPLLVGAGALIVIVGLVVLIVLPRDKGIEVAVSTFTSTTLLPPTTTSVATTTTISPYSEELLDGEFNIAVVAFGVQTSGEDDLHAVREAMRASERLKEFLQAELGGIGDVFNQEQDIDVDLYARPVESDNLTDDLLAVGDRYGADMVVTATLQSDGGGSSFAPIFVVNSTQLAAVVELMGEYGLGSPLQFNGDFSSAAVRVQLNDSVEYRSCVLAYLVTGLSFYIENIHSVAERVFTAVYDGTACPDGTDKELAVGRDIAALYLGNIWLLLGDLETADSWYVAALDAEPEFSRASFGLAEVQFQRGSDECGVDASAEAIADLKEALVDYEEAFDAYKAGIAAGNTEAVPFLEIKARLGLGRVRLCLTSVGEPLGADARSDFLDVIVAYESAIGTDNVILRPVASEAYAGLAFSYLLDGESTEELNAAVDVLTNAIDLDPDTSRLVLFLAIRAWVYDQLGSSERAEADCTAVALLDPIDLSCPIGPNAQFYEPVALSLPFTGTNSGVLLVVGFWLVAIGAILAWSARKSERRTAVQISEISRGDHV